MGLHFFIFRPRTEILGGLFSHAGTGSLFRHFHVLFHIGARMTHFLLLIVARSRGVHVLSIFLNYLKVVRFWLFKLLIRARRSFYSWRTPLCYFTRVNSTWGQINSLQIHKIMFLRITCLITRYLVRWLTLRALTPLGVLKWEDVFVIWTVSLRWFHLLKLFFQLHLVVLGGGFIWMLTFPWDSASSISFCLSTATITLQMFCGSLAFKRSIQGRLGSAVENGPQLCWMLKVWSHESAQLSTRTLSGLRH